METQVDRQRVRFKVVLLIGAFCAWVAMAGVRAFFYAAEQTGIDRFDSELWAEDPRVRPMMYSALSKRLANGLARQQVRALLREPDHIDQAGRSGETDYREFWRYRAMSGEWPDFVVVFDSAGLIEAREARGD